MRVTLVLFAFGAFAVATPLALRNEEFRGQVHALAARVESQVTGYTRLDAPR